MSPQAGRNGFHRNSGTVRHCLRALRVERGLTLKQIAERTGLAVSTLHALEKEERAVTLTTAFKLAHFYGLPVAEIWQPLGRGSARETAAPAR